MRTHVTRKIDNEYFSRRHGQTQRAKVLCLSVTENRVFVYGLNGYTSLGLCNILSDNGWFVSGTCRNATSMEYIQSKGWKSVLYNPAVDTQLCNSAMTLLSQSSHVLISIPPLGLSLYDPVLSQQIKTLSLLKEEGQLRWVGYLSSTGVYGNWGGGWVDERMSVLDLKRIGIYGPGRSALEAAKKSKESLSSENKTRRSKQQFTSRCHVLDICKTVQLSMEQPRPGAIYNVADDDPTPRREVVNFAQMLLLGTSDGKGDEPEGVQPPPSSFGRESSDLMLRAAVNSTLSQEVKHEAVHPAPVKHEAVRPAPVELNHDKGGADGYAAPCTLGKPQAFERAAAAAATLNSVEELQASDRSPAAAVAQLEEKRVCNDLIKLELGVKLHFPSYRKGIAAIQGGDMSPFTLMDLQYLAGQSTSSDLRERSE
ncbi:hypothetical protein CEUSTIGMA_g910.t1 [Chlamydomonas eustigma]|uniref:NAD(P)-binding domain-containing protein n=1 Tax=Chlamydomonas eustigma TaxID=1157962 RepID=A0A250WRK3_9CHLO|nr:hypothetical protein CEUSTIGMA_g910.t1 [Chlamydomonas eustigma]|eukprot:GAX73458.1 hypothetical protein CEUSTIGMA_g910.t1 [Chlamydomonas eustigma]